MKNYSVLMWIGVSSPDGEEIAVTLDKLTDTICLLANVTHVAEIESVEEVI